MTRAEVLRRAAKVLADEGFAPGICSLSKATGQVAIAGRFISWDSTDEVNWCLDDALMRAAHGDMDLVLACWLLLSQAAADASPAISFDEATGAFIDRPLPEVLKLLRIAERRANALDAVETKGREA